MTASLPAVFSVQEFTDTGTLAASYRLYTYIPATTTNKTAYTDAAATTPHTYTADGSGGSYIALNSRGELPAGLYLTSGGYDLTLKTPAGATVWTRRAVGVDDSTGSLSTSLADTASASLGAGMVGYDVDVAYLSGTVGHALSAHGYILQGADPTGVSDSTTAFRALLDMCIPAGREAVIPAGSYKVTGKISSDATLSAGSLNLRCAGDVTITVDSGSTAFPRILSCETTAVNNIRIVGGRLTLDGGNKAGSGIYCRHYGSGGQLTIENLRVVNCKQQGASVIENGGVYIYGRYSLGRIGVIEVNGVDRAGSATASRGILIDQIEGPFEADVLKISNVLATGFAADADGLFLGGYTAGASTTQRSGSFSIRHLEVTDAQGRSLKVQHQDATIRDMIVRRQVVSTFAVPDIDFQVGGGSIDNLELQYIKNAGVSPLNASFYPISLQQTCSDRKQVARIGSVLLRTEVQVPRLIQLTVGATSLDHATHVGEVDLMGYSGMSGSFFSRCMLEFAADQVAASANKTHISARRVRGDMNGVPVLGHTGYSGSVAGKLSWEVTDCINTGTQAAGNLVVGAVSGSVIPSVLSFLVRDNAGFSDLMASGWTFDFQTLPVGCRFNYDIATATDSNPPGAMAGAGIALVEVLGSIGATAGQRSVRVTVGDPTAANTIFQTQTGVWGTIK